MNYIKKLEERKKILNLFSASYPEGCLKWSNESLEHFRVKAEVFHYLKSNSYKVWSEVVLKHHQQRPDILCLHKKGNSAYIIEIKKSEPESSLKLKSEEYPLPIIVVNAKDFKIEEFKL